MKEFAFINAKIVTPLEIFEGSVLVKDGKIVKVMKGGKEFKSQKSKVKNAMQKLEVADGLFFAGLENGEVQTIDLQGKYLLPGLIDVHVHFRTPGMTDKEDWTTGSKAALAGGVTTVLDMPNTVPPTTTVELLEEKRAIVEKDTLVNYGFYMGATNENLEEIKKARNVAGVKVYMGSSTGTLLMKDEAPLEKLMAESGKLLAIHAEKEECIIMKNNKLGIMNHEGGTSRESLDAAVHSRIRAPECAEEAVETVLRLAEKYPEARVHFCHVSTGKELQLVEKFKSQSSKVKNAGQSLKVAGGGVPNSRITVEVTPHHLFLNEGDYATYGNLVKVNPPLRSKEDQEALWKGIEDGVVDMISTDHAPHLLEEKKLPYAQAPAGLPGVQTMLPLLLHAVNAGKLSLQKVVELTSFNPARIFGIHGKGEILEGFDADFTVVDLEMVERVCHHYLWTKPDWSPFHGWHLKGWPVMTYVGGELMYGWREKFGIARGNEVKFDA